MQHCIIYHTDSQGWLLVLAMSPVTWPDSPTLTEELLSSPGGEEGLARLLLAVQGAVRTVWWVGSLLVPVSPVSPSPSPSSQQLRSLPPGPHLVGAANQAWLSALVR